jgi:hypothetical protein
VSEPGLEIVVAEIMKPFFNNLTRGIWTHHDIGKMEKNVRKRKEGD